MTSISANKHSGCIPGLAFIFGIIITAFLSFQKSQVVVGIYSVTHTQTEWQSELDTLRMLSNTVGYQLTRQQSDQWQEVIFRMQQRIITQVAAQIAEEQKKATDTTKHKNK